MPYKKAFDAIQKIGSDSSNNKEKSDIFKKGLTRDIYEKMDNSKKMVIRSIDIYDLRKDITSLSDYIKNKSNKVTGQDKKPKKLEKLEENLKVIYDYKMRWLMKDKNALMLKEEILEYTDPLNGERKIRMQKDQFNPIYYHQDKYKDITGIDALNAFDQAHKYLAELISTTNSDSLLFHMLERIQPLFQKTEDKMKEIQQSLPQTPIELQSPIEIHSPSQITDAQSEDIGTDQQIDLITKTDITQALSTVKSITRRDSTYQDVLNKLTQLRDKMQKGKKLGLSAEAKSYWRNTLQVNASSEMKDELNAIIERARVRSSSSFSTKRGEDEQKIIT